MINRCLHRVTHPGRMRGLLALGCLLAVAACSGGCAGGRVFTGDGPPSKFDQLLQKSPSEKEKDLRPSDYLAELAKGRNLERAAKHDEARKIYERLIAGYPNRCDAYHRLGVVADHQRRHREAEALYTQAIRLKGNDSQLFNDLGYCLFLQGKLQKAESSLLKAVALRPSDARARNNLGLILGHLGRYEEALEQFRHGGSEGDAYYNLAFVRASREEVDEAKECFRLALAADPTHERARRALETFSQYENDPEGLEHLDAFVQDGVRWVPYIEGETAESSAAVEPVPHEVDLYSPETSPSTRPDTQSLLKRARSMMSRRTAQKQAEL